MKKSVQIVTTATLLFLTACEELGLLAPDVNTTTNESRQSSSRHNDFNSLESSLLYKEEQKLSEPVDCTVIDDYVIVMDGKEYEYRVSNNDAFILSTFQDPTFKYHLKSACRTYIDGGVNITTTQNQIFALENGDIILTITNGEDEEFLYAQIYEDRTNDETLLLVYGMLNKASADFLRE